MPRPTGSGYVPVSRPPRGRRGARGAPRSRRRDGHDREGRPSARRARRGSARRGLQAPRPSSSSRCVDLLPTVSPRCRRRTPCPRTRSDAIRLYSRATVLVDPGSSQPVQRVMGRHTHVGLRHMQTVDRAHDS
jgi:hypothetical protein